MKLIFYHENCNDGLIAAMVTGSAFKNEECIYASLNYSRDVYQNAMKALLQFGTIKDIIFVDFGPDEETIKYILSHNITATIVDHHKTFADKFANFFNNYPYGIHDYKIVVKDAFTFNYAGAITYHYDVNKCGSTLAYEVFHEKEYLKNGMPTLLKYIEDRDLWLNKMQPETDYISEAIRYEEDYIRSKFNTGDIYSYNTLESLKNKGRHYSKYKYNIIDNTVAYWDRNKTYIHVNGTKIPAICYPLFQSEIGNIIAKEYKICCVYNVDLFKNLITISFRSTDKSARLFAELFDGGGHDNAAGAKITIDKFKSILM